MVNFKLTRACPVGTDLFISNFMDVVTSCDVNVGFIISHGNNLVLQPPFFKETNATDAFITGESEAAFTKMMMQRFSLQITDLFYRCSLFDVIQKLLFLLSDNSSFKNIFIFLKTYTAPLQTEEYNIKL